MRKNHPPEIKQKNIALLLMDLKCTRRHSEQFTRQITGWKYAKNFIWINKWQPFWWDMSKINFIIHNIAPVQNYMLKPDKLLLTIYIQCKYHHWLAKCLPHKVDRIFMKQLFSLPPDLKNQHHLKTHSSQSKVQTHRDQALFASFVRKKYIPKQFWM